MAVPHSGMLGKAAETWNEDGDRDRVNRQKMLWFRNKNWSFEALAEARRNEDWSIVLSLKEQQVRAARCARALDTLRAIYREHRPDVAIIIGKDQKEIFLDTSPSLAIYTGEQVFNGPPQRPVYAPAKAVTYPAHPELAQYLMGTFKNDGFDMAEVIKWPINTWMKDPLPIVPHAYGFIYNQIMENQVPPHVPLIMNTFYPPNQPSFERSLQFGHSLFKAISDWDTDKTVAIIASGGLSHFVCDEQLDAQFLKHFRAYDFDALSKIDDRSYQSGTSEVKLYVPVLVAMAKLGCEMNLVDYVPCYRTEAGTGEGFGFMAWTPH
jgi:3-O-methylgallate 3,4-dioxygenase